MDFLLYGANGYTAQLMLPLLRSYGLNPVLAGRSADKIEPLARQYDLPYRIFDLANAEATRAALADVPLVLHCAGPFVHTARPMMEACLHNRCHYLDITGEIGVFEMAARLGDRAREQGITLLPGSGFDVVPTDCLAAFLHQQLPDATHLALAFANVGGGLSQGTARTMAEGLGDGGAMRRNGKIVPMPLGHRAMEVDFGGLRRFVMTIPWGDVATAFYTTGIPNIEVFTAVHPRTYRRMQWLKYFNWFLRLPWVRHLAKQRIAKQAPGPSAEKRAAAQSYIWGQVRNAADTVVEARLRTPDGYTLTAHSALLLTKKILAGEGKPGFWTPAGLFGPDLVLEIPGSERFYPV